MSIKNNYDFSGWATRNDITCADGLTIRQDAFKECDGKEVPLVYMHDHDNVENVLGHALLENREDGVYCYGKFNEDTDQGMKAKALVAHGDITSLSIYANKLVKRGSDVLHGAIREVSLVLAGANPGATIDFPVLQHSDGSFEDVEDEAIISYKQPLAMSEELTHFFEEDDEEEDLNHADEEDDDDPVLQDVLDSFDDDQQKALEIMMAASYDQGYKDAQNEDNENGDEEVEQSAINNDEGDEVMHKNVFEKDTKDEVLKHGMNAETEAAIFADIKNAGSIKSATLQHGIDQIDWLFPEAKSASATPDWIKRDTGWVGGVLNGVHHTPYSRIKSMFADIREDEARAKGYIKDDYKKEEVFSLLKRSTTPQTIYKKQKLDRDDIIDITDFDVVAWIKAEMRMMLDEEIARAILVGDGRLASSDEKIQEDHVRPIWKDDPLYSVKVKVTYAAGADDNAKAQANIKALIKNRKLYKGSGNPKFYTTEDVLADMLLITDTTGRFIYDSVQALANKIRVSEIVTVPVMDNLTRVDTDTKTYQLLGIMVNLQDYNVGADKGGAVNMFDDFDIDYNKEIYLIETRISGALTVPFSALVLETEVSNG